MPTSRDKALREALARVEAVDLQQGMSSTGGNLSLYANLLSNFLAGQSQSQTLARIRRHLAQGDRSSARRMAHTLKGIAATLGAGPLSNSAAALEKLLSQPYEEHLLESALADTQGQLEILVGVLRPLSGALGRAVEAKKSRQIPSPGLLHTIGELLAEDDTRAFELWTAHAAVLKALVPNGELVDSAIRNFDFEQALQLLGPV